MILIYYENKKWEPFLDYLKKLDKPFRIVTDNISLFNLLKENGYESSILDELVPERGEIVWEVYQYSKKLLEDYRTSFNSITQNNVKVFSCFDFAFFLQLHFLSRIKRAFEQEEKSTIFLFQRFFPIFFSIGKILEKVDNSKIGLIRNGNVDFFTNKVNVKKKIVKFRVFSFLASPIYKKNFLKNTLRISNYLIELTYQKLKMNFGMNNYQNYLIKNLQNIEKKILRFCQNKIEVIFFISGSREDLYIRPLYGIFEKLDNEKIGYLVITDNISTSLVLTNKQIQHISLDRVIKSLSNQFKISTQGKEILEDIDVIAQKNPQLPGIMELKNFISEKILESILTLKIVEFILSKLNPKSIYAGLDGEILENSAINLAKRDGISNFSMLPSLTNPNPIVKEWFHAEKIFLPGKLSFDMLKKLGYDENRLVIIGHPKYDFLKKISSEESRKKLKKEFNFDQKKKLVTIAMSQWNENDDKWMSDFIKFCNDNNFEIIIKIHPMYKVTNNELSTNKIELIKKLCARNKFWITYDFDIYSLLSASDLVITDFSNVGIEAKLLGKPVIAANFSSPAWDYLQLEETGAAIMVKNTEELEKISKKILEKGLEYNQKEIEAIVNNYNFKNDGNASERIFKSLLGYTETMDSE